MCSRKYIELNSKIHILYLFVSTIYNNFKIRSTIFQIIMHYNSPWFLQLVESLKSEIKKISLLFIEII